MKGPDLIYIWNLCLFSSLNKTVGSCSVKMYSNPLLDVMTVKVFVKLRNINKQTVNNFNGNIEVVAKHMLYKLECKENIVKNA